MSDHEQRFYSAHGLNIVFTISSVIFLISILAMFWKDYDREWRSHQATFRKIEIEKNEALLADNEAALKQKGEYNQLTSKVEALESAQSEQRVELGKKQDELDSLQKQHSVAMQNMNFEKARLSAVTYQFEQAREHGQEGKAEKLRKRLDALATSSDGKSLVVEGIETQMAAMGKGIKLINADLIAARRELSAVTADRDLVERRLSQLDRARMDAATRVGDKVRDFPVLDMFNARYNVRDYQVIVNGITEDMIFKRVPRVDRCSVCHVAIDRPGFEDQLNPYKTHPNLETFLSASSPHPIKEFGCTSCHGGRGRGTSFTSATHMPENNEQKHQWEEDHHWHKLHHWDRPMYPAKYSEAGCYECHSGSTEIKGADTLNLGLALITRAGCYSCHEIQQFKEKGKAGPGLYHVGAKTTRDWAFRWIQDPKSFRAHTWMPAFFNQTNQADIRQRNEQEIHAMVHYLFETSAEYILPFGDAPKGNVSEGESLVRALGCQGCHMADGDEYSDTLDLQGLRRQQGPQLVGLGSKTTATWIYNWLKDPKSYHPETRMPNLRLTDQEAADIAEYLASLKISEFDQQAVPSVDEAVLNQITRDFLVKNMTQAEVDKTLADMSTADKQLYSGEKLIRHYGCFGCHDIAGFEGARPIGTPLTEEGSKAISKFDFGLQHDIEHINYAWFEAKLQNPRIFDQGLEKAPNNRLKMPNFNLERESVDALVTTLLGFRKPDEELKKMVPRTPERLAIEAGEAILADLNCRGCHIVDHEGGAILDSVAYWYENIRQDEAEEDTSAEDDEWGEEDVWGEEEEGGDTDAMAVTYSPPNITGEGAKVQPDWLFHFLQQPSTIRPWLKVRMPTYGLTDDKLNTLVKYFNALDDQEFPFASQVNVDQNSKEFLWAENAFSPAMMNCARCHIKGGVTPEGMTADNWAPDLAMAHERLKADWVVKWLEDPQSLLPGTKMPQFWTAGGKSPMEGLDRDSPRQREAIRDYIFTLLNQK